MRLSHAAAGMLALCMGVRSLAGTTQPTQPPLPAPGKACTGAEYRQFDFWLGDWTVAGPKGTPAGTNRITLEHDGCVLAEHWNGAKGGTGSSFNVYDAADKHWHQVWVDNQGSILQLSGGIVDGKMILEGPGVGPKGEAVVNRIAWEKLADGRVRQTWTVSSDGGSSWSTAFDGFYTKRQ